MKSHHSRRAVMLLFLLWRVVLLLSGAFCLYYGFFMLFFVPGYPGEAYWQRERVVYGVVPLVLSVILFLASYAPSFRRHSAAHAAQLTGKK